jgi:hypothetical protein
MTVLLSTGLGMINLKRSTFLALNNLSALIFRPCSEFLNTQKYFQISVEKCFCLNANQALIVYYPSQEKSNFSRRTIFGPGIFMIEPNEWVHKFSWHGQDDKHKTRYIADSNRFEVLNLAPSQLYYNVDELRTSDDALIRIKLMIFYELKSIETMVMDHNVYS